MNEINVLLRLLNGRRFQGEMAASAASVRKFGAEVVSTQASTTALDSALTAANGSMYAIGGASRVAAIGVGVLAATVVGAGIKFDMSMETAQLSFQKFAGGVEGAKKVTSELFKIAQNTPFSFNDILQGERRFLAFGFSVKESTSLLKTLGDTLSYTGGGTDEIMRLTKAFGDIRSKGRLMQQEMNQLVNVGIPVQKIFQLGGLEFTAKQLKNVGKAGIDADTAIGALQKGLNKYYGGGAKAYNKTLAGQIQRFKDNFSKASGDANTGVFKWLKDGMTGINKFLENPKTITKFGESWKNVGNFIIKYAVQGFKIGKKYIGEFLQALAPAKPFWENVLKPLIIGLGKGLLGTVVLGFKVVIGVIKILAPILGWLGKKLAFAKGFFEGFGVVLSFFVGGLLLRAISFLGKFGGVFKIIAGVAKVALIPLNFMVKTLKLVGGAVALVLGKMIGFAAKFIRPIAKVIEIMKSLEHAIWINVGKALSAVSDRLGKFGESFFNMGVKAKNAFVRGIKGIGKAILGAFTVGVAFFGNIGRGIKNWLNDNTLFGNKIHIPIVGDIKIPALAKGGLIKKAGDVLVGERGPEILRLPEGASVIPMNRQKDYSLHSAGVQSLRTSRRAMIGHAEDRITQIKMPRTYSSTTDKRETPHELSTKYPSAASPRPMRRAPERRPDGTLAGTLAPKFEGINVAVSAPVYLDRRKIGEAMGTYVAERKARK